MERLLLCKVLLMKHNLKYKTQTPKHQILYVITTLFLASGKWYHHASYFLGKHFKNFPDARNKMKQKYHKTIYFFIRIQIVLQHLWGSFKWACWSAHFTGSKGTYFRITERELGHAVKCCAALLLNLWTTKTKRLCIRSRKDSSSLFEIHEKWWII